MSAFVITRRQIVMAMALLTSSTAIRVAFAEEVQLENDVTPGIQPLALAVDGYWGSDTTRALERYFGLPVTGIVPNQWADNKQAGLTTGWQWDYTGYGCNLIKRLQAMLGTDVDGLFGQNDIRALQSRMGTFEDGTLRAGSSCIKELQRRLTNGYV